MNFIDLELLFRQFNEHTKVTQTMHKANNPRSEKAAQEKTKATAVELFAPNKRLLEGYRLTDFITLPGEA